MSDKLEDYEKSLTLAHIINEMKPLLRQIDLDNAREAVKTFMSQANWQDSAAVLNPNYDPEKSNLLRVMGEAMEHLVDFVVLLRKCDKMKITVAANAAVRSEIAKMFL